MTATRTWVSCRDGSYYGRRAWRDHPFNSSDDAKTAGSVIVVHGYPEHVAWRPARRSAVDPCEEIFGEGQLSGLVHYFAIGATAEWHGIDHLVVTVSVPPDAETGLRSIRVVNPVDGAGETVFADAFRVE